MRRRPMVCILLCMMAGIWLLCWLEMDWIWRSPAGKLPEKVAKEEKVVYAEGIVYLQEEKETEENIITYLYLKHANLRIYSKKYPIRNLKCKIDHKIGNQIGYRMALSGVLKLPKEPSNPGGFHQRKYERSKKIDFYLEKTKIIEKEKKAEKRITFVTDIQQKCEQVLKNIYPEETAGILEAMLLGKKTLLKEDVKAFYQAAGISHIMAISGLHISMIGAAVWKLLKKIGCSTGLSAVCAIAVLISYGILIGTPATAFRALTMFGIMLGGKVFGRAYDRLSALATAGILLLLDCPDLLFDCGFQLSFLAVCFLSIMPKVGRRDKFQALQTGIYLWFASLPVVLYHFYQVSFVGIFVNLFVIPLMPFVVGAGLCSLIVGFVSVGWGSVIGLIAYWVVKIYTRLGMWAEKMPFGTWTPGKPEIFMILIYYVIFFSGLYFSKQNKKKKIITGVILLVCILAPWNQKVCITMLDVGQGDGILLQAEGENFMIDGGSTSQKEVGKYVLLPYLKHQGISCLDGILLTHSDQDHVNGAKEVLVEARKGWLTVKNLYLPWWMKETIVGKELIQEAKKQKISCEFLKAGDKISWKNGTWTVCYPTIKEKLPEPNAGSLVFIWQWKDKRAIFTGDLPMEQDTEVMEQMGDTLERCDVLKIAHHGANGSTSMEFLKKIEPEIALISCGEHNFYGHPGKYLLDRLKKINCDIYRTDQMGAVTVRWK